MNKVLHFLVILTFTFSLAPCTALAQNQTELWGMTSFGGNGGGIIFKTDGNGNHQKIIHSFLENPGQSPQYAQLFQTDNGKLYGLTPNGGSTGNGVLFEYDPASSTYTKKIDFDGANNGAFPFGSLIQAGNGKLYGMTAHGGMSDYGVLFEYDPDSSTYTKKLDFGTGIITGRGPNGSLILADNGKLYGMTSMGGVTTNGVLFEYDPDSSTYTNKLDFGTGIITGRGPNGSLIQADNGKLYGMTRNGGANNYGVLFEYDLDSSTYTNKLDFDGANNGKNPYGSLMQADNGKLYGMTSAGGVSNLGVLFEYDPATLTYTKQLDFFDTLSGRDPMGSLMQAANRKLYGMTSRGGISDMGVLFEYDPDSSTYSKKIDFAGASNGRRPLGSLMQANNGKLYGMTFQGGKSNYGVLFEFDTDSSIYIKKLDFANANNGGLPYGPLMQSVKGKLYGMTSQGGESNYGVLFEFDPSTSTYSKKIDFDGVNNGSNPLGSLMQAANGKLYGMTYQGGANDYGVLFEFDPVISTYTKKIDFAGTANGSSPTGSLMQANNGKMYGMTNQGGLSGYGVLFEFDPVTSIYIKKFEFDDIANGRNPTGSLMQAANGKLYGMTRIGGASNNGALFEYDPDSSTYTKKIDFDGASNGSYPLGDLMQASNGKIYGMTFQGGTSGYGVLFEYDPDSSTYIKKLDFPGATNGGSPPGSLIQAANGKLYGMTYQGGTSGFGVLFEYDPTTSTFIRNLNFTGANGQYPMYTHLIEICSQPETIINPMEASVCTASETSFFITATGNGLTYQWQVDEGSGFGSIADNAIYSGALNDTLDIIGALASMNNFQYRCVVTSTCPVAGIVSDTAMLTVHPIFTFTESHEICKDKTYNWHGNNYSIQGIYYDSLMTVSGCDSVYILNFSVITVNTSLTVTDTTTIANANGADYQWLDCGNNYLPVSGANLQVFTAPVSGNFAVEVTENGCTDTSICTFISSVGIIENTFNTLISFPNPTSGLFNIDMGSVYTFLNITISDLQGREIKNENLINIKRIKFMMNEPAGIYIIKITSGIDRAIIRVIKTNVY